MPVIKSPKLKIKRARLQICSRIGKRFDKFSRAQKIVFAVLAFFIILPGSILVIAELGGYGVNGPATAPNSLNYGLVGYWDFEEGQGQVVKDKSGSGSDGTLGVNSSVGSDDPVFVSGHDSSGEVGTGLKLDGVDDKLEMTDKTVGSVQTISAWLRVDPSNGGGAVSFTSSGTTGYYSYTHYITPTAFKFQISSGGGVCNTLWSINHGVDASMWHLWTYERNDTSVTLYVDGVYVGGQTITSCGSTVFSGLGVSATSGPVFKYFNGSMDEVRIYNRILSEDEIRLLYNQKKPILQLKMDEGSGVTAKDESFNNNDGTIYGTWGQASSATNNTLTATRTWSVNEWQGENVEIISGAGSGQVRTVLSNTSNQITITPVWSVNPDSTSYYRITSKHEWTDGKSGSAINFDGVDTYLEVKDSPSVNPVKNITMEAWIYPTGKSGTTSWNRIISKDNGGSGYVLALRDGNNDDTLDNIIYRFNGSSAFIPATITYNTWYHLVVSYDGTNVKVYQDGQNIYTAAYSSTISSGTDVITIGNLKNSADNFKGIMDDVRVYSYARTVDEVKADYNEGLAADLGKSNQNLNKGLVGYWDFEEGQGQTAKDKSGNGSDCTLGSSSSIDSADPVFASGFSSGGAKGTGIKFDGVDDYTNMGRGNNLNITGSVTIGAWIKVSDSSVNQYFISKRSYSLRLSSSEIPQFETRSADDSTFDTNAVGTSSLAVGTWNYVVGVYNTQTQQKIVYINGVAGAPVSKTDGSIYDSSSRDLQIGKYTAGNSYYFGDVIDEVRIYNRALSADEIRTLYNQKKPILQLKMDEGSGTMARDESFNNNDGTLGGGTAAYMPTWVSGKFGSALNFDGSNDYLGIPRTTPSYVTAGAWVYLKDASTGGGQPSIVQSYSAETNDYGGFRIIQSPNASNFYCVVNTGPTTSTATNTTPSLSLTAWHHIMCTYDGSTINLYVDGSLSKTANVVGAVRSPTTSYNFIGYGKSWSGDTTAASFNGYIDDARIYNYARTASEILTDYNDGQAAHLGQNNQNLNNGLVGYWDMEEGQGQTLKDKSGSGNNGTLGSNSSVNPSDPVFAPGFTSSGAKGMGLKFDGIDDYVDAGNSSSLKPSSITVAAMFKISGGNGTDRRIVSMQSPLSAGYGYELYINSSDGISFRTRDPGAGWMKTISSPTTYTDSNWHQAVGVFSTAGLFLYVDGVQANTDTYPGPLAYSGSNTLKIGRESHPAYGSNFNGTLDEVRIYNRGLSVDEVRALYNQKKPVLQFKMDEGSGIVAKDESFNNNDGTLGGDGVGTDLPAWVQGKWGSALSFDGSNDYISVPNSSSVSIDKMITLEAWVKYGGYASQWSPIFWKDGSYTLDLWTTGSTPRFGVAGGEAISPSSLQVGVWTHLAGTYDGANLRFYMNGIQVSSQARTGNITTNANPLYLGVASGWEYHGLIDDARIYNYARSASEVLTDYNDGQAAHLR